MISPRLCLLLPALLPLPLGAAEPTVIIIRTPPAQMKYDKPSITASPGAEVKLIFENMDEMPHNFVLCQPLPDKTDKGLEVAMLAWQMGAAGHDKGWIPDSPRIIAHTGMVAAHQKEELTFKVPEKPGIYPYVCTFPGHAMVMNGELRVVAEGGLFTSLDYQLFHGDWQSLPDFNTLTPHRSGAIPEKKLTVALEGMTNHFGVRYQGTLMVEEPGQHEFSLASDDGSELSIDGKPVLKNDGIHAAGEVKTRKLRLKKGPHQIRLDYFEGAGQEELYLAWSGPKFSKTPLSEWIHPTHSGNEEVKAADNEFNGLPLAPGKDEAVVYRNFITDVSPRGIAVGYPNGANLCFDADQMAPALFWQGAFIDAKRHWTGRGGGTQPPLGYNILKPAPIGPALAVLAEATTAWPETKGRAPGMQFRGYRLDARRFPAFQYEMGKVSVSETYHPAGNSTKGDLSLTRTVKFTAPEAVPNLYLRAAAGGIVAKDQGWSGSGFTITAAEGAPLLRGNDLLVPVTFSGGTATISITYHWTP
jgi:azurin